MENPINWMIISGYPQFRNPFFLSLWYPPMSHRVLCLVIRRPELCLALQAGGIALLADPCPLQFRGRAQGDHGKNETKAERHGNRCGSPMNLGLKIENQLRVGHMVGLWGCKRARDQWSVSRSKKGQGPIIMSSGTVCMTTCLEKKGLGSLTIGTQAMHQSHPFQSPRLGCCKKRSIATSLFWALQICQMDVVQELMLFSLAFYHQH